MSKCKDCLHYERCYSIYTQDMLDMTNGECVYFTDRSEWVHLPCKVGDMVYKVSFVHKNITPLKVEGFICNLLSRKVHCTHLIPSWIGNQKEYIYISFSSFGKNTFLTHEEAEEALEGMK
mgnify:CR=1 FL=1